MCYGLPMTGGSMLRTLSLSLLTLIPMQEALASDFPMWGAGVRVGTIVVPGAYPMNFPNGVAEDSTLEPARFDLSVGGQALVYADNRSRLGVLGQFGFGSGYNQSSFMGTYEVVLQRGSIDFLAGGGLGFGSQTWKGELDEVLKVPSYPARAQLSAQYRSATSAYALTCFVQANIPSRHIYTLPDGTEGGQVGSAASFANYMHAGLELSALFGDFKLKDAKKKGKEGKKGKKGKKG
jgi:hypothetical protein